MYCNVTLVPKCALWTRYSSKTSSWTIRSRWTWYSSYIIIWGGSDCSSKTQESSTARASWWHISWTNKKYQLHISDQSRISMLSLWKIILLHASYLTLYNRSQGHTESIQKIRPIQSGSHNSLEDMDVDQMPQLDNKIQVDMGMGVSYLV